MRSTRSSGRSRGFANTFAEALRSLGIDASPAMMTRLQAASAGIEHRRVSESRAAYEAWTNETLGRPVSELLGEFQAALIPALEQYHQAPMESFPDVLDCFTELRATSIGVAICSNWGWDIASDLADSGVSRFADVIVSSAQAGCRKPHRDIYNIVLTRAGVAAEDAVFVGDTVETDVLGPQRAGIAGILLDRSAARTEDHGSIRSLTLLAKQIRHRLA
jgi:FMN phosphatase YigB (HAD superfamily)